MKKMGGKKPTLGRGSGGKIKMKGDLTSKGGVGKPGGPGGKRM